MCSTRQLSYCPKEGGGAETEYSNRNYSKPEIDFVKILTTFKNVRRGLKKPLKIFRQGALEGVHMANRGNELFRKFDVDLLELWKTDFV